MTRAVPQFAGNSVNGGPRPAAWYFRIPPLYGRISRIRSCIRSHTD
jgi:hypothetical protein